MHLIEWSADIEQLEPWQNEVDAHYLHNAWGPDVAESVSDDGHFVVGCSVRQGNVDVHLRATRSSWPAHLPEEIGCVVGQNQVRLHLTPVAPLYASLDEVRLDLAAGVDARHVARLGFFTTIGASTDLPVVPGEVGGIRKGEPWGDLKCGVQADRPGWVWVAWSNATRDGEGTCALPTATGEVVVPVRVHRVRSTPAPVDP
jgi:hypothetical protein